MRCPECGPSGTTPTVYSCQYIPASSFFLVPLHIVDTNDGSTETRNPGEKSPTVTVTDGAADDVKESSSRLEASDA